MLRPRNTLLFCSLAAALGACTVNMSTSTSPSDAKPNVSADDAAPDSDAGSDDADASADPSSTLTSKAPGVGEAAAAPDTTDGDAAPDPSSTLTSEPGATCEDGKYKVGESWKDDCNTCQCKEGGKSMCTRMACTGDEAVK